MPTQPINIITENATTEELINELAKFQKIVRYLMNGGLDDENIRADSITTELLKAGSVIAEKINVSELSAINANLGTITAGLLQAVNIIGSTITGSTIRTAASGERIELSSDSFKSYDSSERFNGLILGSSAVNYGDADFYKNGTKYFSIFPVALPNPGMMLASFNGQDLLIGDGNQSIRVNNGSSLDSLSQADSTATTVTDLVNDFNSLLSKLRSLNILA
jgi:hypothetical protein